MTTLDRIGSKMNHHAKKIAYWQKVYRMAIQYPDVEMVLAHSPDANITSWQVTYGDGDEDSGDIDDPQHLVQVILTHTYSDSKFHTLIFAALDDNGTSILGTHTFNVDINGRDGGKIFGSLCGFLLFAVYLIGAIGNRKWNPKNWG